MYTNNWKNGIKLTVMSKAITRDGGEKTTTETALYENIPAYILKVQGSTFSRELGQMTDTDQITLKVGKKPGIQKRMKAILTDKDGGQMGEYIINEVESKRDRGRLIGFYLYLERVGETIGD